LAQAVLAQTILVQATFVQGFIYGDVNRR